MPEIGGGSAGEAPTNEILQHGASILLALNAHIAPFLGWPGSTCRSSTALLTVLNPDTCRVSSTHISVPTRGV